MATAAAGNTTAVVAIHTDFGYGSGVVVGPHEILTASHLLWDANAGRSTSQFSFSAGLFGGLVVATSQLDGEVASQNYVSAIRFNQVNDGGGYISENESARDFAIISVSADLSAYEKAALTPAASPGELHITGYPSWAYGYQVDATANVTLSAFMQTLLFQSPYITHGSSGSPVWREVNGVKTVIGIESSSNQLGYQVAARIDGSNYNQVQTWIAEAEASLARNSTLTSVERPLANNGLSNIYGATPSETLTGTAGRDFFFGSLGSDRINGGAGFDTVIYEAGLRKDYKVTAANGLITVTKVSFGGVDTLSDIQRIVFKDATIAFDLTSDAGYAYRLYQAAFNRTPDRPGLSFWVKMLDNGMSLNDVAVSFVTSPEFRSVYGASPAPKQIVQTLYHNILGREGEQAGVDYWTRSLTTDRTTAQVLIGFSESNENITKLAGVMANGVTLDLL